jgi:hypothetical protein
MKPPFCALNNITTHIISLLLRYEAAAALKNKCEELFDNRSGVGLFCHKRILEGVVVRFVLFDEFFISARFFFHNKFLE